MCIARDTRSNSVEGKRIAQQKKESKQQQQIYLFDTQNSDLMNSQRCRTNVCDLRTIQGRLSYRINIKTKMTLQTSLELPRLRKKRGDDSQ